MDVLDEKIYDLYEKQKIIIEVLFSYLQDQDKMAALGDAAERIKTMENKGEYDKSQ